MLDPLARFKQSMHIGYLQWHDGTGYDLGALSELEGDERQSAEELLLARHLADWRDVEALNHLGSERALAVLRAGLTSDDLEVRAHVLQCLMVRKALSDEQIDEALVSALERVTLLNGQSKILSLANSHRSPLVQRAVLRTALDGTADARCHAAALAHFMHGGSAAAFDMNFRPLYLRFNSTRRSRRIVAFKELCSSVNLDSDALLAEFGEAAKRLWWHFERPMTP